MQTSQSVLTESTTAGASDEGLLRRINNSVRDIATRDPLESLAMVVLGGGYLFYLAERGHNPKVTSYIDALVFVSTSLSVGYANSFACTTVGKALATAIMTVGPALAAMALDPARSAAGQPQPVDPAMLAIQSTIVDKLDAILTELRRTSA